jgi:hypothetical protein
MAIRGPRGVASDGENERNGSKRGGWCIIARCQQAKSEILAHKTYAANQP